MAIEWKNGVEDGYAQVAIDVQVGGPGYPWQVLEAGTGMDAPSGGDEGEATSLFGLTGDGRLMYKGSVVAGLPTRFTFPLRVYIDSLNYLRDHFGEMDNRRKIPNCNPVLGNGLRVRRQCGDYADTSSYHMALAFGDVRRLNRHGWSESPAADPDGGTNVLPKRVTNVSAGYVQYYRGAPKHDDSSTSTIAAAINYIIHRGDYEYWWVTGSLAAANPRIGYTVDKGLTKTHVAINTNATGSATGLAIVGSRVIVVSGTMPPAFANVDDIKNGVASPFTASTGISADYPTAIAATPRGVLWACGAAGKIYKSTDQGASWTELVSPTANALNTVHAVTDELIWFGGASGTLVRYRNGSLAVVAVSGLSATINVVRVPSLRENHLFLGTANGRIYYSYNADETTPLFAQRTFSGVGTGSIADIKFAGEFGSVMFVVQTVSTQSRVMRDVSGGGMGTNDVLVIGSFTSPANTGINTIAAATINELMTGGAINPTTAFAGLVTG